MAITLGTLSRADTQIMGAEKCFVKYIGTDKVAALYDERTNTYVYLVIGTISAGVITWGTPVRVCTTGSNSKYSLEKLATDKVVIAYEGDFYGSRVMRVRIATISGTTPTMQTEYDTGIYDKYPFLAVLSSTKFVLGFGGQTTMYVCDVSGNAITVNGAQTAADVPHDYTIDEKMTGLDSGSFAYLTGSKVVICTVSGSTITFGTATSLGTISDSLYDVGKIIKITATKIAVTYSTQDLYGYTNKFSVQIADISGTTPTFGSEYTIAQDNTRFHGCAVNNGCSLNSTRFAANWMFNNVNQQYVQICTVSGTVVSFGSSSSVAWANSTFGLDMDSQSDSDFIMGFKNASDSSYPNAQTGNEPAATAWTKSLSETISIADTIKKSPEKRTTENPTVTEFLTKLFEKKMTENPTLADSVTKTDQMKRTETLNLVDALIKGLGFSKTQAETLNLTDTRKNTVGKYRTETLNLTDAYKKTLFKYLTDHPNLTDALLKTNGKYRTETVTLTDAINKTDGKFLTEVLTLSDIRKFTSSKNLTEALSVTANALLLTVNKKLSENLTITDSVGLMTVYNRIISENLPLSDAVSAVSEYFRAIGETIALADNLAVNLILSKDLAELLGLQDSQTFSFEKYLQDNFNLSDLLSDIQGHYKSLADQMNLSDEVKSAVDKKIDDSISLVDNLAMAMELSRDLSDMLGLQDGLKFDIGKYVNDNTTLSDILTTVSLFYKNLIENLNLSDEVKLVIEKNLTDNLASSDHLTFSIEKILSSMTTLSDIFVAGVGKAITDGTTLSDNLTEILTRTLDITENLVVSEVLMTDVGKGLSENLSIADYINTATNYHIDIQDSVAVIEKLVKSYDLSLREAIALVDSLTKELMRPLPRETVIPRNKDRVVLVNAKRDRILLISKLK